MRLLTFLVTKEVEEAGEDALDGLKQRVFASAFGSFNPKDALKQYYEIFEKEEADPEYDYPVEEFVPENEQDVEEMLNQVRRAGIVS